MLCLFAMNEIVSQNLTSSQEEVKSNFKPFIIMFFLFFKNNIEGMQMKSLVCIFFQPSRITEFENVEWLQSSSLSGQQGAESGQLQMEVNGEAEPLIIKCSSLSQAEDIADLIMGYCRLVGNQRMTWTRKGKQHHQSSTQYTRLHSYSASHDNLCTVGGDGGCRVGEVRAGTTSPIPDHKGFELQ